LANDYNPASAQGLTGEEYTTRGRVSNDKHPTKKAALSSRLHYAPYTLSPLFEIISGLSPGNEGDGKSTF